MATAEKSVRTYRELASCYDAQGQAQVRDRYLVLAADTALASGRAAEAEAIRAYLLQVNPHHLLKPFASLAQALESVDVRTYVEGLRRTYPPESAELALRALRPEGEEAGAPRPVPVAAAVASGDDWEEVKMAPISTPAPQAVPLPPVLAPREPPKAAPLEMPKPAPKVEAPIPFAGPPSPRTAEPPRKTRSSRSSDLDADEEEEFQGNWLASALFLVVLLATLALGAYTLVRPFL